MQFTTEIKQKQILKEIENLGNFFLIGEKAASHSLLFGLL